MDPVLAFESRRAWEEWLGANHDTSPGVWLALAKKGSAIPSVSYDDALEVALCFGWIDGQKGRVDDASWRQRFVPRSARSKWSERNRALAEGLIARGSMRAAGLGQIDAAKADGRWDAAYPGQAAATVPDDFQQALDADDVAADAFARLDRSNRYAILYRIHDAKRPETRARRIQKFVTMLREGGRLHP